jgi:uncharacterized protein (TIGR02302 family)
MWAEQIVRCFWPLWTVIFVITAPLFLGWHLYLSVELLWAYWMLSAVALIVALIYGVRLFDVPTRRAAMARVDAALPGRPIAALEDEQAIGQGDAASVAVWKAHITRMQARTKEAQSIPADLRVAAKDPYGLRFIALLFFLVAVLFGGYWPLQNTQTVAGNTEALKQGPTWEGWVAPPSYTGKPTIYLGDVPKGPLRIAQGSTVTLRLYGELGALTVDETISGRAGDIGAASDLQQSFAVTGSGRLAITGDPEASWDVTVAIDQPPLVELTGPIEADAQGEMAQPFVAMDDYGVVSGTAVIALDPERVTRHHGLTMDPDPLENLVLDLPMPFTGDRTDFEDFLVENLSQHPLANLPVTLTLQVVDAAGQSHETPPEQMILPGRRFFQPFARAIIEQRRDLMWSRKNAPRIVQILKALAHRPEGLFANETTYLRMRLITRRLESVEELGVSPAVQNEIVEAMWDLAIQLEDGTLADARQRLQRAQERLAEAMRNGASDAEIAALMQELRDATDAYMQLLANEMDPDEDGTDEPDTSENSFRFTQDELQALMDRIQELMEEGRMAEAEELMQQLNQLLENMRITQGEGDGDGPRTPGQRSMEDLAETLRDQEDLSDEAFRELQERSNPQGQQGQSGQNDGQNSRSGETGGVGSEAQNGQQSDNGQGGEGGTEQSTGETLAERQQALRDELQRQRAELPRLEGEAGDIARRALELAERAMDEAERALKDDDLAQAIDRQADAMNALRNGMRNLADALTQNRGENQDRGDAQGETTGRAEPSRQDPLGRELGSGGRYGTDENLLQGGDVYRRAEELLQELRRRSSEQNRPDVERHYLRRLLDRF